MISHGVFVVLDVMWLAGVLKPIVDHRGITKSKKGKPVREGCEVVSEFIASVATGGRDNQPDPRSCSGSTMFDVSTQTGSEENRS